MKQDRIKYNFVKYVSLNSIGMVGLSCYILADTFFVARGLGASGLAALNLAIPIYSFIHGTGLMIGMGGATRFAISKSKTVFTQALHYTLCMAVLFLAIGILVPNQLASLLGADHETLQYTSTYLRTILLFAPMFLLNNVILCFVRNDNNPRLAMIAMLAGSFSNIILDYVFIFPCKMGMFGAAFATGLAPVISLCLLSIHFTRKRNTFGFVRQRPAVKAMADVTAIGVPALITEFSSGIVIITFNGIMLTLAGNLGVAAYGIIANIALVVTSVFTGISQGMQPIISRCHGCKNHADIKKVMRYGFLTALFVACMAFIVTFLFAQSIVLAFNKETNEQLVELAVQGMRLYFTAFFFVGINILTASYFSAVDKPKHAFLISFLKGFVVIIPTAFILSFLFGIHGVWIALTCSECIVLFVSMRLLLRAKQSTEPRSILENPCLTSSASDGER